MTWTFNATSITTDLAKVRSRCGDVNTNDQLLTDEQINAILSDNPDLDEAAAISCEEIIAKLARDVDRSNLGMSASRSQKIQHFTDVADRLRGRAVAKVSFGGASDSDKDTIESDADFPLPLIRRTQNDNTSSTT